MSDPFPESILKFQWPVADNVIVEIRLCCKFAYSLSYRSGLEWASSSLREGRGGPGAEAGQEPSLTLSQTRSCCVRPNGNPVEIRILGNSKIPISNCYRQISEITECYNVHYVITHDLSNHTQFQVCTTTLSLVFIYHITTLSDFVYV